MNVCVCFFVVVCVCVYVCVCVCVCICACVTCHQDQRTGVWCWPALPFNSWMRGGHPLQLVSKSEAGGDHLPGLSPVVPTSVYPSQLMLLFIFALARVRVCSGGRRPEACDSGLTVSSVRHINSHELGKCRPCACPCPPTLIYGRLRPGRIVLWCGLAGHMHPWASMHGPTCDACL